MSTFKCLALIAAGYALAFGAGCAAVALNELFMPEDISQTSGGMVAFGDMILFVVVTGFFGLLPTWFLLRLCIEKAPGSLLATELAIAAMGPLSWLVVTAMAMSGPAGGPSRLPDWPQAAQQLLGLFIAFAAIPRMVLGPVMMVIEGMTWFMIRERVARMLLAAAVLADVVPISLFVLHMARSVRY